MFILQRAFGFVWIIILIISLVVSSLNLQWMFPPARSGSGGPSEITDVVSENGFTLRLAGVTISGDADVAPTGTPIQARLGTSELPAAVSEFATPTGQGVEITLGDGLQPETPMTITFDPGLVSGWYADAGSSDDLMPVVFASKDEAPGVEFADAHMQPDGSVVVEADHLSWRWPSLISVSGFSEKLEEQLLIAMDVRSNQPTCVGRNAADVGWEVSTIPNQLLWPCVNETRSGLEVTLTDNSPEVWLVTSDAATPGGAGVLAFPQIVIAAASYRFVDSRTTGVIVPGGSVTFTAQSPPDVIGFEAKLNGSLTTVNAFAQGISPFIPSKKLQAIGEAQCLIDLIQVAIAGPENVPASYVRSVITCFGSIVGGLAGVVIGAVAAIPGAATSVIDTVVRKLTGRDQFAFTVSRFEVPPTPTPTPIPTITPSGSAWPTDRNDGPSSLYIWLGANFYGLPDWVACDDARNWCLLGYTGEWHVLMRMNGLEPVAEIIDTYPDPREGLLSIGLPEDVVDQILGD